MTKNELKKCEVVYDGKILVGYDTDDGTMIVDKRNGNIYEICEIYSWSDRGIEHSTLDVCMLMELETDPTEADEATWPSAYIANDDDRDLLYKTETNSNILRFCFGAGEDSVKTICAYFEHKLSREE